MNGLFAELGQVQQILGVHHEEEVKAPPAHGHPAPGFQSPDSAVNAPNAVDSVMWAFKQPVAAHVGIRHIHFLDASRHP